MRVAFDHNWSQTQSLKTSEECLALLHYNPEEYLSCSRFMNLTWIHHKLRFSPGKSATQEAKVGVSSYDDGFLENTRYNPHRLHWNEKIINLLDRLNEDLKIERPLLATCSSKMTLQGARVGSSYYEIKWIGLQKRWNHCSKKRPFWGQQQALFERDQKLTKRWTKCIELRRRLRFVVEQYVSSKSRLSNSDIVEGKKTSFKVIQKY